MRLDTPKALVVSDPTDCSVTLKWEKVLGAQGYRIYGKEFEADWSTAPYQDYDVETFSAEFNKNMRPTSTYEFRLVALGGGDIEDSLPSKETVCDTQVAGCAGESKGNSSNEEKKCSLQ